MTTGVRIAQKRKELGLSQEQLGEQLGVSRQSIYKWESDAALPEVEKLVALSKLFSVTVGWLLGVEDESRETQDGELTEAQLRMVEEIAARYRPAPNPQKRRQLMTAATVVTAVVAAVFIALFAQTSTLRRAYNTLQDQVGNMQYTLQDVQNGQAELYDQIDGITNDITKREKIVSSYDVDDWYNEDMHSKTTVTYTVSATPKTYTEGMEAVFIAQCDGKTTEVPAELGDGKCFSGKITLPAVDKRTIISVAFINDGIRQTEVLYDTYED